MDLESASKLMEEAIKHLEQEFSKLQAGRASTAMVEDMLVRAYGQDQPLKNVAGISTPDPQTILIQPWDKGVLADLEKSIRDRSDLGLNPNNDGNSIWIKLPQPTEERRKELVKVANGKAEEARISIRNARQELHKENQRLLLEKEISEDQAKGNEADLQETVDSHNKRVEEHLKKKEQEIMTV